MSNLSECRYRIKKSDEFICSVLYILSIFVFLATLYFTFTVSGLFSKLSNQQMINSMSGYTSAFIFFIGSTLSAVLYGLGKIIEVLKMIYISNEILIEQNESKDKINL